jgi:Transcriptional regulator
MSRSNINYEKKRDELAREIFNIFMEDGYENTTLSLIIKKVGISKGAFYHYFSTKEACADAAVALFAEDCFQKVEAQIDENASVEVKFHRLIVSCSELFHTNEQRLENINTASNAIFHQKLMAAFVIALAPLYAKVITQGVEEKIFKVEFPLETAQMILTLTNFYFDADLFGWQPQDMPAKINAFIAFITNALNARTDFFSFLTVN